MDVLEQRNDFRLTSVFDGAPAQADLKPEESLAFGTPAYRAIHRSVLAGLLGNIAHYDEENRLYKAAHDRKVVLFPGSVLHRREEPRRRPAEGQPRDGGEEGAEAAALDHGGGDCGNQPDLRPDLRPPRSGLGGGPRVAPA
jgi:hypothetical protein